MTRRDLSRRDAESASTARDYRNGDSSKSFRVKDRSWNEHASILDPRLVRFEDETRVEGHRRPRERIILAIASDDDGDR